jgi:hypothetical protein
VSEQFLNRANVVAVLQEVGGKRVTKGMGTHGFGESRQLRALQARPLLFFKKQK